MSLSPEIPDPPSLSEPVERVAAVDDLTAHFYRLSHIAPHEQRIVDARPDETSLSVLDRMKRQEFSQVPVRVQSEVVGMFSHRTFMKALIANPRASLEELLVADCLDTNPPYARPTDEFSSVFAALDREGYVLVGDSSRLQCIVTPDDVVRHLHQRATPFFLLRECELTLRALIEVSVPREDVPRFIADGLAKHEERRSVLPTELEGLTLSEHVTLMTQASTWARFAAALGGGNDMRRRFVATRLRDLVKLRNDVFHFRRNLDPESLTLLLACRDWLLGLARAADVRRRRAP